MLSLVANAEAVLTDSGGLQKETVLLGTRCVTLRDETEWTETLENNWNILAGAEEKSIMESLKKEITGARGDHFGDGKAGEKILNALFE